MTEQLPKEKRDQIVDEWIAALRSGEYQQGQHALAGPDRNGVMRYCCLGVLCEVMLKHIQLEVDDSNAHKMYGEEKAWETLPAEVTDAMSMDGCGRFCWFDKSAHINGKSDLAELNDELDLTFSEIADVIEERRDYLVGRSELEKPEEI
jgi:hypothetical protein